MEVQERVIDSQTFNANYFVLIFVTSDIMRKNQVQMGSEKQNRRASTTTRTISTSAMQ